VINPTWRPELCVDEEHCLRWPGTECCTITSSNIVLLYVYFLRLKKQRFHGTMGKSKYKAFIFLCFYSMSILLLSMKIANFALKNPFKILLSVAEKLYKPWPIIFKNSCMVFRKWLFHLLSVNVNFITLHSVIVSIYRLPIYKVAFYLPIFVNMWNGGQRKVNVLNYKSGKSQGIVKEFWFVN